MACVVSDMFMACVPAKQAVGYIYFHVRKLPRRNFNLSTKVNWTTILYKYLMTLHYTLFFYIILRQNIRRPFQYIWSQIKYITKTIGQSEIKQTSEHLSSECVKYYATNTLETEILWIVITLENMGTCMWCLCVNTVLSLKVNILHKFENFWNTVFCDNHSTLV